MSVPARYLIRLAEEYRASDTPDAADQQEMQHAFAALLANEPLF